ncbi:MAG: glycosyltransferase family 39 protein, partial [Chloroflexota bacterium]|nr:glycosyltransferase family 39 protein [Chloroflexota bacterium]
MTRREAWLSAGLVFVVALVVRTYFAAQIVFPKPEDTAYYVGVARNLLEGRGLVSDALWSYQTPPLIFPRPAFEVWLPLPTFLAAIPMAIFGHTFAAAQVSSVLVGAVVPVLAWRLVLDVADERRLDATRRRWVALGTGLTTAVYLPLLLNSALPDSTMPFTAIVLAATLLMTRVLRDPRGARLGDPRLIGLGLLLGLGALTRNETVWLALIWAGLVWFVVTGTPALRVRLIAIVAVVAVVVFAPWAYRNLQAFGSPLPGQAITNAMYLTGYDIFAWNHPPTLARHLGIGTVALVELRIAGLSHNLFNVLVLLGIPVSVLGLLALPWQARGAVLRPLVWISLIMFFVTSLLFPAATQWGTFLHAAGPVHVLLVVCGVVAMDAGIARLGRRMGWTRPIAWLTAAMGVGVSLLFSAAFMPTFGTGSRGTAAIYQELGSRMAAAGHPLDRTAGPVITNFPIWLAETQRVSTLALPDETPEDVLDLART